MGGFPYRAALRTALDALRHGDDPVVMFGEGERKDGPRVLPLMDGPVYLAARAQVPIVPVGIGGTAAAMLRGAKFMYPRRIKFIIGEPMDPPPPGPSGRVSRRAVRELTEELRERIQDAVRPSSSRRRHAQRALSDLRRVSGCSRQELPQPSAHHGRSSASDAVPTGCAAPLGVGDRVGVVAQRFRGLPGRCLSRDSQRAGRRAPYSWAVGSRLESATRFFCPGRHRQAAPCPAALCGPQRSLSCAARRRCSLCRSLRASRARR